jgi:flagellar FliL protein
VAEDKSKKAEAAAPSSRFKLTLSKKKLFILLAAFALLVGAAVGAWLFFGHNTEDTSTSAPAQTGKSADARKADSKKGDSRKADTKKEEKKKKIVEYLSGDPYYTVNLSDQESDRFLQLGLVFEISDLKAVEQLKERMPVVRSNILLLLSSKESRELLTVEGKKKLAADVLAIVRQPLDVSPPENGIEAVDFSVFVIQ